MTAHIVSALVPVTVAPTVSEPLIITVERDIPTDPVTTESDTGTITIRDLPSTDWIALGAPQKTKIDGRRIVWPLRVRGSIDGPFDVSIDPDNDTLALGGPSLLVDGVCDFAAQPKRDGEWMLTVVQGELSDSVTLQALPAAPAPTARHYDMSKKIDAFFDHVSKKYGYRPRFVPVSVSDVRASHSTERTYARYSQGSQVAGPVFGAISLNYRVIIAYTAVLSAEADLPILKQEADRYDWGTIGFSANVQTMFEPGAMEPRLTLDLEFDIIPQNVR